MPVPDHGSMHVTAFGATDTGRVRARNEDTFLVDLAAGLVVVADGMGGHAAGDVASQTAVARLADAFHASGDLPAAVGAANHALIERARQSAELTGMGTTITAVYLQSNLLHCAHVGDSRLYRLRAGRLTQLTRDHTVAEDMIEQGALTRAAAMGHPLSSMLTRAIGSRTEVEVDAFTESLEKGDLLLLCSDGLSGLVSDEDLTVLLGQELELELLAGQLIEAANLRGGTDNITVVLVRVG